MKQAAAISALLLVPLHLDPAGGKLFLWQSLPQLHVPVGRIVALCVRGVALGLVRLPRIATDVPSDVQAT